MIIKKEIEINCTAEQFWSYIIELEKMQEWNVCLLESKNVSSGNLKEGFKSKILMKEGEKSVWYENEILDYNPHSLLRTSLKGGNLGKSQMFVTYKIDPQKDGVKVSYENEWEPKGLFMKLFAKKIFSTMDKNATKDLQAIKNRAEK